jgi:hypothetical protein
MWLVRTIVAALFAITALHRSVEGQISRQPQRPKEKTAWTSLSIGFMQLSDVADGRTNSEWRFGNAVQYRVSLEKSIQNQSTIGLSGGFARVPLTYRTVTGTGPIGCTLSCDADATVTQLVATFHAGGGAIGFHQVIDIAAGATGYSSFRARQSGAKLPPNTLDADLTLALGYGFGFSLAPDMQVNLVQEAALTLHQRTGLPGGENTLGRQYITRIGVRFGL